MCVSKLHWGKSCLVSLIWKRGQIIQDSKEELHLRRPLDSFREKKTLETRRGLHCEQKFWFWVFRIMPVHNDPLYEWWSLSLYHATLLNTRYTLWFTVALGGSGSLRGRGVVLGLRHRVSIFALATWWSVDVPILEEKGEAAFTENLGKISSGSGGRVTTFPLGYHLESVWEYIYMCVYLDFWIQICILRQCIISDHICKFLWLHFGYINHQNAEIQQWPQKMSRMKHWLLVSNIIFTPTYVEKWPNLTSNIFTWVSNHQLSAAFIFERFLETTGSLMLIFMFSP